MKQIDECLNRYFSDKPFLKSKKWKALTHPIDNDLLLMYHYQHLILVFDKEKQVVLYQWWELPADKRGLDYSLKYLKNKYGNISFKR